MSLNSFTHNFYRPPAISANKQPKTFHLILQSLQVCVQASNAAALARGDLLLLG